MGRTVRFALLAALALGAAGALAPDTARADAPEALRPGTNPWFFDAGFGWANNLEDLGGQFKLVQEIGYHFSGNASGPAIGAAISESMGNGFFTFAAGFKFWWDIQIVQDLGLYVSPFAVAGFAVATQSGFTSGFFNFQGGAQVKLIINDTWNVFVRPLAFDFFAGDFFAVRYDFIAGGVITF